MTDEQGRILGKVSIVDIFAVLAVILIAVSIYMRLGNAGTKTITAAYSSDYQYTLVAESVSSHTAKALEKSVGDDLFTKNGEKIGTIEKIDLVTPSLLPAKRKNGDVITIPHPEKSDVRMIINCHATQAHAGILAEGSYIISNGANIDFETKYTFAAGRVNNVHRIIK